MRDHGTTKTCATNWGGGLKKKIDMSGNFINQTFPLPSSCVQPDEIGTPIQEFFRGSHILVTGVTGLVGKALIEKLVVACPGIEKIYVLIRESRGKNAEERLKTLLKQDVFRRAEKLKPNFKDIFVPVNGDCSKPKLGLSEETLEELAKKINIVFHVAATVKFTEKLADAVRVNVAGVKEIIDFCKLCKNLKSVVHVSTAYTNCLPDTLQIEEKVYPPVRDYKEILETLKRDPELLNREEDSIITPWPNTYCFTKKLAEDLVTQESLGLPIAIFRPAVVTASYLEPMAGWIDSINGPSSIIVGSFLGVFHVIPVEGSKTANLVPVDYCVNGLICSAWKVRKVESAEEIPVYNYTSQGRNRMTWGDFTKWTIVYGWNWVSTKMVWHPFFVFISNPFLIAIFSFLLHTIPAYLLDTYFRLTKQKPFLVNTKQKMAMVYDVIKYFVSINWSWTDKNVLSLWEEISPLDKAIFPFDIAELDWDLYAQYNVLGLRVHFLKDPIETLPEGRALLARFRILHRLVISILICLALWGLYQIFHLVTS